jgi:hypothetical protein
MCSSTSARLARICRAIDELENLGAAGRGVEAGGSAGASGGAGEGRGEGHDVAESPTALRRAAGAVGESAAGAGGDGVADGDSEAGADGDSEADTKGDGRTGAEGESGADADVASRLAEIWAMIADADPELAKRLPRYLGRHS